jgi:aspartate carbamoyltransferase catalytic subunit
VIDDLLSMEDLSADHITRILDTAEQFKDLVTTEAQPGQAARSIKKVPVLRGRTICNLFYEDSTRTRISFEVAEKRLSADVINFSAKGSSVSKGESLKDTALTLQAMGVDAIVIRHQTSGAPRRLTEWVDAKVLNAGDGWHQHPTQALLDLYTIRERLGRLEGLRVAVCGDIVHSRVARSLVQGLATMGCDVTLVAPPTLMPAEVATWPATISHDLDGVLDGLDVCYLLRVQHERMAQQFFPSVREYARIWGMDIDRLARMPEHALIMHPGPMNRGVEISADVADAEQAVITAQVTNGVAVRMSCLYLMLGGEEAGSAGGGEEAGSAGGGEEAGSAGGGEEAGSAGGGEDAPTATGPAAEEGSA